ncbi:MAG: transcriptional regulator [Thiohalorhabdaceae bacterium]
MFRKDLINALLNQPTGINELARHFGLGEREMAGELEHLRQSFRNEPYRLVVHPATCRKCGFTFGSDRMTKPGKCPRCWSTWIQEPRIGVEPT